MAKTPRTGNLFYQFKKTEAFIIKKIDEKAGVSTTVEVKSETTLEVTVLKNGVIRRRSRK